MPSIQNITPCLWFDGQAEEAARFYTAIFDNSKITRTTRYPAAGQEIHGKPEGTVMTVEIELDGHPFTLLNGGPEFKFSEAISFQVLCKTQAEIDYFWERLGAGGDEDRRQCGWLADRFGVSWQIVPVGLDEMTSDENREAAARTMTAMLSMKKLDLAALRKAYEGSK